ncbi:M9 family metallopeptidase N-terminal domain-containing protein, partial [Bacillus cereus]|uniref:M9 family metallopeptidase N-terminal domain-containing protein n=1 Tax=Bacillus cereus TaxID=1396 RepID=UPI003600D9B2
MNKKSKINKVMLSISTMALSLGALQTLAVADEKVPYNVLKTKPVGIEKPVDEVGHVSKVDETLSFQERLKVGEFSQRPASITKKTAVKQVKESYSMADLNKMNNQELVETLGSIKWHQITDLFQ